MFLPGELQRRFLIVVIYALSASDAGDAHQESAELGASRPTPCEERRAR